MKVAAPEPETLYRELIFKSSRSGGSGGQNVNKVSTKVEIHFSIPSSTLLTDEQKIRLLEKLSGKLSEAGVLRIVSSEERTQPGNKKRVLEKFNKIIISAFRERKKRVATKPSRSSKEKRLSQKKKQSEIKKLRRDSGI